MEDAGFSSHNWSSWCSISCFLPARTLSAAKIMRMSDSGVENVFLRLRWPETDGKPVCPDCGCLICYACRRSSGQLRWHC